MQAQVVRKTVLQEKPIPGKTTAGESPGDTKSGTPLTRHRDYIDARAPHDPDDIKRLLRAEGLAKTGEFKTAMIIIQALLDRKNDSLVRDENGEWVSVRGKANELLQKFPENFHKMYRLKYGTTARLRLDAARETGDVREIANVATQFFHTAAGLEAARDLCALYLDRAEYGIASRWYLRILKSNHSDTKNPRWLLQAAYALRRSGDTAEADRILHLAEARLNGAALTVGGKNIVPREWFKKVTQADVGPQEMREWWTLFGNASRTGVVQGGEPLLLPRWSHPLTSSHLLRRKMEQLFETLRDNHRALIPASVPLTVDGKVVFRTLRGVSVADAETGRILWETREGYSAERLLTRRPPTTRYYSRVRFARTSSSGSSTQADYHPLTGYLFRNGPHGLISSDGKQLFVIEDLALLPNVTANSRFSSNDPEKTDPYRRSWMTSKLVAYDLKTGRPNWEIGGLKRKESFDLPLAGNYFLGTPVSDGKQLYVVAEESNRIRLHVLDPASGRPKWSRLIAYSDTKISDDSVRRWFTAQVTLKHGVIVCPTTVGWLIGVDQSNRAILWGHRYSKPNSDSSSNTSTNLVSPEPLNGRWQPSAPVIVSGHVIYTPQEDPSIVCLRLRDGKRVWRQAKSNFLYLAGVHNGNAILVGTDSVRAIRVSDGNNVWTRTIPTSAGPPSGMGALVGDSYHLPLSGSQLWTIGLKDGSVISKSYLPSNGQAPGNLSMYRGQVLSLNAWGITSYEQRDALAKQIQQRRSRIPDDPWAALKEAEIALLSRDFASALKSLKTIAPERLDEHLSERYRKAMVQTLQAVVRSNFKKYDAETRRLEELIKTPEERFTLSTLLAQRHEARGDHEAAFWAYFDIAGKDGTRSIRRSDQQQVELRAAVWVAGKLADLWQHTSPEIRHKIDTRLQQIAGRMNSKPAKEQLAFCRLIAFHALAGQLQMALANSLATNGEFGKAELILSELRRKPDKQIAADATDQLAQVLIRAGMPYDARFLYRELARTNPDAKLADGKSVTQRLAELNSGGRDGAELQPVSWANYLLKAEESGTEYKSYPDQELMVVANPYPYFANHSFRIDRDDQQLIVKRNSDGAIVWLAPLRSRSNSSSGYYVFGETFEHCVLLMHQGVLQCLSPVDKQVLWSRPIDADPNAARFYYSYYSSPPFNVRSRPLAVGGQIQDHYSLRNQVSKNGGIAFANGRCIGVFGKRRLEVLDAINGNVLWTLRSLPADSHVVATTEMVFIIPPNASQGFVLRAMDGKPVKSAAPLNDVANAVAVSGRNLLLADTRQSNFLGIDYTQVTWKLVDSVDGRVIWKRDYGSTTKHGLLADGNIAVITRSGTLDIINAETGTVQSYPSMGWAAKNAREIYAVADRDTVFVAADFDQQSGPMYNEPEGIRFSGLIFAFDRKTGRKLWFMPVTGQNLLLEQFSKSPVLTFMTRTYVRNQSTRNHWSRAVLPPLLTFLTRNVSRNGWGTVVGMQILGPLFNPNTTRPAGAALPQHWAMEMLILDKRTGRILLRDDRASVQSYGTFTVNVKDRYVEFRTYSSRMRLTAHKRPIKAPVPKSAQ